VRGDPRISCTGRALLAVERPDAAADAQRRWRAGRAPWPPRTWSVTTSRAALRRLGQAEEAAQICRARRIVVSAPTGPRR
jgi:hypothetical protein